MMHYYKWVSHVNNTVASSLVEQVTTLWSQQIAIELYPATSLMLYTKKGELSAHGITMIRYKSC